MDRDAPEVDRAELELILPSPASVYENVITAVNRGENFVKARTDRNSLQDQPFRIVENW